MSPSPLTYAKRESILEQVSREWRLEPDMLVAALPTLTQRLPLNQVTAIRLSFAPTEYKPWRYRCVVKLKDGRRTEFDNGHFAGVADFTDQSAAYRAFVLALLEQLRAASPAARLEIGETTSAYMGQIALVTVAAAALLLVLMLTAGAAVVLGPVLWNAAFILISLPLLLAWLRRARPRRINLDDPLPPDALPPA